MTDKQVVITAVFFVIGYGITIFFVFRYLYKVKLHVRNLYQKTANLGEQARDAKAIAQEAQQDLGLVKIQITRNY